MTSSLHEIINNDELKGYIHLASSNEKTAMNQLVTKMLKPRIEDNKHISLMGWKFNVTSTIYHKAFANEVNSGFQYLSARGFAVDIYVKVLFIRSIHNMMLLESNTKTEVDKDTIIDHVLEPEILELLRLCYWIEKCRNDLSDSFEIKFKEVKNALDIDFDSREKINTSISEYSKIAQNTDIPFKTRKKAVDLFYQQTQSFIKDLSSYLPEFMLAEIVHENGFNVQFNKTRQSKSCDLRFEYYQTEVKTRIDDSFYKKIERNLEKELEGTLKKLKVVEAVNEALGKKADIAFLFLTFTSLGIGFGKFNYKTKNHINIQKALNLSLSFAKQNRQKSMNSIPVVIFCTLVDTVDNKYKIFSITLPYPVKKVNDQFFANPEKLIIDL